MSVNIYIVKLKPYPQFNGLTASLSLLLVAFRSAN